MDENKNQLSSEIKNTNSKIEKRGKTAKLWIQYIKPVSYTHLDVYKRQDLFVMHLLKSQQKKLFITKLFRVNHTNCKL